MYLRSLNSSTHPNIASLTRPSSHAQGFSEAFSGIIPESAARTRVDPGSHGVLTLRFAQPVTPAS
jgi:hypothetical protein